jgi:hypothetical protein
MRRIIVKRGRWRTYTAFNLEYGDHPEVDVIWDRRRTIDRRQAEQPTPTEHRVGERRRPAPASWTASHHVIVSVDESA